MELNAMPVVLTKEYHSVVLITCICRKIWSSKNLGPHSRNLL